MRRIAISSGHGLHIRGARGSPVPPQLDEVDQARRVVDRVAQMLGCPKFHDNTSTSQSTNLNTITNWHNALGSSGRDLDVSVHFNAFDHSAHGTEVLYVTQETIARHVCDAICAAGAFTNRGAKYRSDLAFLNNTSKPSILIETCFCDHTGDSNAFQAHFEEICTAIAESIADQDVSSPPGETEPPSPHDPWSIPVEDRSQIGRGDEGSDVEDCQRMLPEFAGGVDGDFGPITEDAVFSYQRSRGLAADGIVGPQTWASLYERTPPIDEAEPGIWHNNITATEFGGGSDEQDSAYPDIDWITSSTRGVALPYKWKQTPRPKVEIVGPSGSIVTEIVDLGPWNTNDPDYVYGGERPMVEAQYANGDEAQNGRVPTNDAAIDLTPPIADAVGISGKGKVKWRFV